MRASRTVKDVYVGELSVSYTCPPQFDRSTLGAHRRQGLFVVEQGGATDTAQLLARASQILGMALIALLRHAGHIAMTGGETAAYSKLSIFVAAKHHRNVPRSRAHPAHGYVEGGRRGRERDRHVAAGCICGGALGNAHRLRLA